MIRTCGRIGFTLSAVLHAAVIAAVVSSQPRSTRFESTAAPVAISLEMFKPLPVRETRVAARSTTPEPESVVRPPAPVAPVSEPPTQDVKPTLRSQQVPIKRKRPQPKPKRKNLTRVPVAKLLLTERRVERNRVAGVFSQSSTGRAIANDDGQTDHIKATFLAELTTRINRAKYYPKASRRWREQGTVVVSFVVLKDGRLVDIRVRNSSGFERLDQAAVETLQKISPIQAIPDALNKGSWSLSVPIAFSLHR